MYHQEALGPMKKKLLAAAAGLIFAPVLEIGAAYADDSKYTACVNAGIDMNNCHLIINQATETNACNMEVGNGNLVQAFLIRQGYSEQMARVGAAIACS